MSLKNWLCAVACIETLGLAGCASPPYVPPTDGPVATIYGQLSTTQGLALVTFRHSSSFGRGFGLLSNGKGGALKASTTVQANQAWHFALQEFLGDGSTCGADASFYAQAGESYDVIAGDTPAQTVKTIFGNGPAWGSAGVMHCWVRVYQMTPSGWVSM